MFTNSKTTHRKNIDKPKTGIDTGLGLSWNTKDSSVEKLIVSILGVRSLRNHRKRIDLHYNSSGSTKISAMEPDKEFC